MAWSWRSLESLGIVEAVYQGEVSAAELQESASTAIELEKSQGQRRFLVDCSNIRLSPSTSLADIYNLPAVQYEAEGADREAAIAVFAPAESSEFDAIQFYETACVNRNWNVKLFLDRDEAIEWLTGQPMQSAT